MGRGAFGNDTHASNSCGCVARAAENLQQMNFRLLLRCLLCLGVFVASASGHAQSQTVAQRAQESPRQPATTALSATPTAFSRQLTATASPSSSNNAPVQKPEQGISADLSKIESNVRPAVIWVTAFDQKGNLLRTESGFFISGDGRLVTTARAIEGAVNAVVKTGDGGIHNVTGALAVSKESDLAVLQADVKRVAFVELNKNSNVPADTSVVVVGSGLAGADGEVREMPVAAQSSDHLEIRGATVASALGSPVVNEAGEVVGVVTAIGDKTTARRSAAVQSLLSRVAADTQARWPQTAEKTPTPKPTPKPRLVYAPAPAFPPGMSQPGVSGTGRFRLSFDSNGNATNVQVVKSTGNAYFDQSAIKTLRQWKSAPSHGWEVTVPVTFQTR